MYENVDGYLKDKDRQTIYMHQFFYVWKLF